MNRNISFNTKEGLYYFDNSVLNCAHIVDKFFSTMLPIFENTHVCAEWCFEDDEIISQILGNANFINMGMVINQVLLDNLCEEWGNALCEYDPETSVSGLYENGSFNITISFKGEEYEFELNNEFNLPDFYHKIGIEM